MPPLTGAAKDVRHADAAPFPVAHRAYRARGAGMPGRATRMRPRHDPGAKRGPDRFAAPFFGQTTGETVMSKAGKQAWVCWIVAAAGLALALRLALGPAGSAEGAGEAIGRLVALTGTAAFATWFVARRRTPAWGWPRFVASYVLAVVLIAVVTAFGRARAGDAARPFPLALEAPAGWTSENLDGLSSAPQDRLLGQRLRQQREGAAGKVVLEASCGWLERNDAGAPGAELAALQRSLAEAYGAQGLQVEPSAIRGVRHGGREWQVARIEVHQDGTAVLVQRIAMGRSTRCALTVVLAGAPAEVAAHEARFAEALETLRVD